MHGDQNPLSESLRSQSGIQISEAVVLLTDTNTTRLNDVESLAFSQHQMDLFTLAVP